jgi:hypothetical protein
MSEDSNFIVESLRRVAAERHARASTPGLQARVQAVKAYQQRRFAITYADLLVTPRYAPASRFFLDELYGPHDFSERDAQFERVVPALVRIFPQEIIDTVASLARLHALSESLDTEMAQQVEAVASPLNARSYVHMWRMAGRSDDRATQIELTLALGSALDRHTRKAVLRHTLRMMRAPAKAAGLLKLQHFLEAGFGAFRAMHGADEFLSMIRSREQALVVALFDRSARVDEEGWVRSKTAQPIQLPGAI